MSMSGRIEELEEKIIGLEARIKDLEGRNAELNTRLMSKSAAVSKLEETLARWRLELELVANQKGHNLCWIDIPNLLKRTIGYTGIYPDPEDVTKSEFQAGCQAYVEEVFKDKE